MAFIRAGLLAFAALGSLCACTHVVDESALVTPHPGPALDLAATRAQWPTHAVAPLRLTGADGTVLQGVLFTRDDARATVLYFGGNGYRVAAFWRDTLSSYRGSPVNVVMVDHRGYGPNAGVPTIAALLADAVAVYDQVRALPALAGKPLLVHGQSLGSFMAGEVARQRRLDGLILESSVTNGREWMQAMNTGVSLLSRIEIDPDLAERGNLSLMAALDEPVFFVVGERDTTTPAALTRRLYGSANLPPERKVLLIVPGAGHNDAHADTRFSITFARWLDHVTG